MRRLLQRLAVGAMILGAGVGAFVWLSSMKAAPEREEQRETRPLVETRPLEHLQSEFDIELDGTVVPQREITLAAEVSGEIIEKSPLCRAGNYVTEGTPVLVIDRQKHELEVRRLQSLVQQAQVDLQQIDVEQQNVGALIEIAERDVALKQREMQRIAGLFSRSAAAEGERDTVEATLLLAQTTLQQLRNKRGLFPSQRARAEAELQLKRSELAAAEIDLAKTEIKAPISGMIVDAPVEFRQYVNPGTVLVKIEDTSVVEVSCSLRVEDLDWLWRCGHKSADCPKSSSEPCYEIPPAAARVIYRLGNRQYEWSGRLARYEGTGVDSKTRTVPCRVVVDQPRRAEKAGGPPALVRGMFVEVKLPVVAEERLLRVPHDAVRPNGEVFTVEEGRLHAHQVEAARVLSDGLLVRAASGGLKLGDKLVMSPLSSGFEGMEVRERSAP